MKKAEYVDPMIGTVGDEQEESFHGGGKTYPGACVPGGMIQLSPDTVTGGDNGTGYNYCHNSIEGFSLNRMSGIGWYGDLGNVQIMPVTGDTDLRSGSNEEMPFEKGTEGWKSAFGHENEIAKAGYYSVLLDRYGIKAETTVSERTGMLRFTYPQNSDARVIFNFSRRIGGHADFEKIEIINDRRIEGSVHCTPAGGGLGRGGGNISYNLYFVIETSVPVKSMRFFANEEFAQEGIKSFEHKDAGMLAQFGNELKEPLVIKCAISYTDIDGTRKNFAADAYGFDFDGMAEAAFNKWEKAFDGANVEGSNETDKKLFYTCLYHVLLDPRIAADTDGRFTIVNDIFEAEYTHRTVFSGWDVYRSEFPLLTLISPETVNDEVNSLIRIAEHKGTSLPRWEVLSNDSKSMVGDPAVIMASDAYIKGIRNFDVQKLYDISKASALCADEFAGKPFTTVRRKSEQYLKEAYVPERLSDTLELLLADYTMAKLAKALGKNEDYEFFMNRAKRYPENYNEQLGFMAPRYSDGSFVFEQDEYDDDGTVESNIYQQSWFVPYDVEGLSELFGKERTFTLLERFFEKADFKRLWNDDYNHSNEPCHNITHYFDILGKPDRTQYWTRRVQKEAYRTGAFGFCGNEDVGQLSAWYVLSALGFAQVCPTNDEYYINTPLFKSAKIRLDPKYHSCVEDKAFAVECDKDPEEYPYIAAVYFNGEKVTRPYLTYAEITSGGVMKVELSKEPCESFEA